MSLLLSIATPEGGFDAHVCRGRAGVPAPVIVILPELPGIDLGMREICEEFARLGYCAVCPDLPWRAGPASAPAGAALDVARGLDDLVATVAAARKLPGVNGRVGLVGYGPGGLLAFLAGVCCHPDAVVAYYCTGIDTYLDLAVRADVPLLLHFGDSDETIPPAVLAAVVAALDPLPLAEVEIHPRAGHAFARRHSASFDAETAESAARYTADFLRAHLT